MSRVLRWNGTDLPEELRKLPPGEYLVEPVDDRPPPLAPEEEEGIRQALASVRAGRVTSHDEVRRSLDRLLQR